MKDLRNLTEAEMQDLAKEAGQPAFRGRQLFGWVYKGRTDFREMTNLPEVFTAWLKDNAELDSLKLLARQKSKTDGTQKFLYGLKDGNAVETVFMKYKYGNTVCVSSQAGCRMHCAFCASGINGLVRSLTAGEIISQLLDTERETGEKISRIVVMGTGEPFDNYDQISRFIRILHEKDGRNMSSRNITVSSCGLVPGIRKFSEDFPQVNLAVSLHAPVSSLRDELMPVNHSYPLEELIPACRAYTEKTGRRITFEYALIRGKNDTDEMIGKLIHLLRGMLCHVNLIPLNEVSETGLLTSGRKRAEEIQKRLEDSGIPATVRRQLGADIDGACGQLRLKAQKQSDDSSVTVK
ncbi:MAG: 23S rRNA (adenine(2503)-C(2))-methyltransferase RlmN [Eubacterium sp.]|jgi:23S rRNA (adenine2503-C2)-methyltransferase|nr:23S rRNA (adenine(2503)-C(2))-methyltransferase RlmN [Eubacterium sp.]MCI2197024.1 23S rRNA (adenine(2503)-C(2))-methyltransferase RlmN [Eubacterium sp.]